MTPGITLLLVVWVGCVVAGYHLGKHKGQKWEGVALTVLLGLLGIVIVALLPRTRAAKIAAAQQKYEIEMEAQRRAGYSYPPPGQHPQG